MRKAAGVFEPKYRATCAPHGARSFCAVVGRARAICSYLAVRSIGQEDGSSQWGVIHEHTRRPTPVFMNTQKINSNFHRPTWACGGRPPAPKQHTPTPVDGAFDGRPLQHHESQFWASNPKFPFVHEQTTPAASRTASSGQGRRASSTAQPMVGRVEASKRATCAADHLRATYEPRTEGGGAVKCGYKQLKSHTRRHIEGLVSKRCWGCFV